MSNTETVTSTLKVNDERVLVIKQERIEIYNFWRRRKYVIRLTIEQSPEFGSWLEQLPVQITEFRGPLRPPNHAQEGQEPQHGATWSDQPVRRERARVIPARTMLVSPITMAMMAPARPPPVPKSPVYMVRCSPA